MKKKFLAALVCAATVLSIAGCSNSEGRNDVSESSDTISSSENTTVGNGGGNTDSSENTESPDNSENTGSSDNPESADNSENASDNTSAEESSPPRSIMTKWMCFMFREKNLISPKLRFPILNIGSTNMVRS